jgi:hypothetical protein
MGKACDKVFKNPLPCSIEFLQPKILETTLKKIEKLVFYFGQKILEAFLMKSSKIVRNRPSNVKPGR